ncbi:MAG: hypothetical protein L0229_15380 [Blastocatellia bacterium]|nr:hypothetical protein [Blastocatellia bacterium]
MEENRIRKLFRELREDDERLASSFDRLMEAATAHPVRRGRRGLRLAIITAALALIAGLAFALLTTTSTTVDDAPEKISEEQIESPLPPNAHEPNDHKSEIAEKAPLDIRKSSFRKRVRRRMPDRTLRAARLISEWRSPTGFLLEPSGKELFTAVPQPGESVVEIKWILPREKN